MGLRNWLFGSTSQDSTDNSEADDDEAVEIELESVEQEITHTFEQTITRTVTLLHFAKGGSLVVEYDDQHANGQSSVYKSVTDYSSNGRQYAASRCANLVYDNVVSTVNDMAVSHYEDIGEIEVTIRRAASLTMNYEKLVSNGLPDGVVDERGIPEFHGNTFVDQDGRELERDYYGHGWFESFNGEIVYDKSYSFNEWTEDVTIETDKDMGDVLGDAIAGRTDQMQAVSAEGQVLLSDTDGTTADMVQVQSLPSGGEQ